MNDFHDESLKQFNKLVPNGWVNSVIFEFITGAIRFFILALIINQLK